MSVTTGVDRRALLDQLTDPGDRLVEALGDLAQRDDRRQQVVDDRARRSVRPRRSSTTPAAGIVCPPSARVVDDHVERAAVVGDRLDRLLDLLLRGQQQRHRVEVLGPGRGARRDPVDAGDDRLARSAAPVAAGTRRPAARPAARSASPIQSEDHRASSRPRSPPSAAIPGSGRDDDVELRVDRLDGRLERLAGARTRPLRARRRACSGSPTSTPARGGPGSAPPPARRSRPARARTLRSTSTWVLIARTSEAVGQRVHVAVLDERLLDDLAEHRRGRLQLRDVGGVAADPPATPSSSATELSMSIDGPDQHDQQHRHRERGGEPDQQRDRPASGGRTSPRRRASSAHRHLPQRPRRVQDPHARVVDPPDAARARRSAARTCSTPATAPRACLAIRDRQ